MSIKDDLKYNDTFSMVRFHETYLSTSEGQQSSHVDGP